ncbi:MAG: VWA domain-containing protein [Congregibacter sp.]
MELMETFHFLRPHWLWMLVPAMLIGALLWRHQGREASWQTVIAADLLQHLISDESIQQSRRIVPLLILSWCIGAIAAAGPSWRELPQPVLQKQDALVLIMDLSYSMLATDLQPSRHDRVRRKLLDLLQSREEGLTALIAYAGDAHIVAPLTDDNPTIANLLPALTPQMMPLPGSNALDAVQQAMSLLDSAGVRNGRLALVTDGVDADDASAIGELLAGQPRELVVLGVGTDVGAPIALPEGGFLKDDAGNIVVPALDEAALANLASSAGGVYVRMQVDDADIRVISEQRRPLDDEDTITLDREADQWEDMAHWFTLPLLLACLAAFRRGWVYVLLPLSIAMIPAEKSYAFEWADLWRTADQQGKTALDSGDAAAAARLFESPAWRGKAAFEHGDYDSAIRAFSEDQSSDGWYNRGNALAAAGRFDEAIQAYEESLALEPEREDAQKNKALIEQLKQQQEQQQQDDQPSQDDGQDGQQQQGPQQQSGNSGERNQEQEQQQNPDQQPGENQQAQNQEQTRDEENQSAGDENQSEAAEPKPMPQPQIDNSAMQEDLEKDQAMQQWLRRVPDDPSGLLREKFRYESRQRQRQGNTRESKKIW